MKNIGYSEFVTLCNVEDPGEWCGWLLLRDDGIYVKPLPSGIVLTKHERSILTEHPLNDLTKPLLAFPCSFEELQTFDENQGLGLSLDGAPRDAQQAATDTGCVAPTVTVLRPEEGVGLSKRERQLRVIETAIANLGLSPMCIPTGQKKRVGDECKRISSLFGAGVDPFKEAWQEAVNQKRVRTEKHSSYSRK